MSLTGKGAMVKRHSASKAMETVQIRLQDLTRRCNKFQAKYAERKPENGAVHDSIGIAFRSPVSDSLGKASAANCMATCSCLDAACSSAALADSTASNPAKSCGTTFDVAPTAAAYPAAACVNRHLAQPISTSTCGDHVTTCSHTARSGTANALHDGECHVHAISTRTWHARCSSTKMQPVYISHRQVLQQGIVQLQQQLAHDREMMVQRRMHAARQMFSDTVRCR